MLFIKNDQIVFIINYKCLFSTFNKLVDNKNILKKKNIKSIQILSKKQFYIIVKNPIKRLISFYKDKILNQVKILNKFTQNCIQELLKYYNKEFIISTKFNFSILVDAIKKGYRNKHFDPQFILYDEIKDFDININIQIMKVEDENFNTNLENILNTTLSKSNNTDYIIFNEEIKQDDINYLKEFYKRDYELFNYN